MSNHRILVALSAALTASSIAGLSADGAAQTLPEWMIAEGAAAKFSQNTTNYHSRNSYLASAFASACYPSKVGMAVWQDLPWKRAEYQSRMTKAFLMGKNWYRKGSSFVKREGWGFEKITFFRDQFTDAEGYIVSNPSYTMIAFRGSEAVNNPFTNMGYTDIMSMIGDWLFTDLNTTPRPLGGGKVHRGFYNHMNSVLPQIMSQLWNTHGYKQGTSKPIWLTGHSLGGAAAILAAYRLSVSYKYPVKGVYTIGQPMVGDQAFAKAYLDRGLVLHRVVNATDIVARAFGETMGIAGEINEIRFRVNWRIDAELGGSRTLKSIVRVALQGSQTVGGAFVALANPTNVAYVHFGNLRYFDRYGSYRSNPSSTFRRNDRVQALADSVFAIVKAKRSSILSMPSNWAMPVSFGLLRAIKDHYAHPDGASTPNATYMRLLRKRCEAKYGSSMSGLPKV